MASLNDLTKASRRFIERYPFPNLDAPVLTPLQKPVNQLKLALVTTAGLHLKSDKPFARLFQSSDCSYRILPADVSIEELKISHTSDEFDRSGVLIDLNVVLPIRPVKELVNQGKLGSIAPRHFSFMGSLPRVGDLKKKFAPALAEELKVDRVDIVLLTPV